MKDSAMSLFAPPTRTVYDTGSAPVGVPVMDRMIPGRLSSGDEFKKRGFHAPKTGDGRE